MRLDEVISLYKSVGHRGIDYLNWLHDMFSSVCLPCVSPRYGEVLGEDKTKLAIFIMLLDDLADNYTTRSRPLLDEFLQIPWREGTTGHEYLVVGRRIWEEFLGSVKQYPRFKEFERMFYFDLRQVLASADYSSLINTMGLDNGLEMSIHSPYGCAGMLCVDMDLMSTPEFDVKDLGTMRGISLLAQRVAHIANVLGTYPREALERDLSCPMISLAVRKGVIREDELGHKEVMRKLVGLEWVFRKRAEYYVQRILASEKHIHSVDIRGFSGRLARLVEKWPAGPEIASIQLESVRSLKEDVTRSNF
jgi:hypothetical protein